MLPRRAALFAAAIACGLGCGLPATRATGQSVDGIVAGADDDGDTAVVGIAAEGTILCTGTVIADRVIVTAAHCLRNKAARDVRVLFGSSPDDGRWADVVDVQPHPDFDPVT